MSVIARHRSLSQALPELAIISAGMASSGYRLCGELKQHLRDGDFGESYLMGRKVSQFFFVTTSGILAERNRKTARKVDENPTFRLVLYHSVIYLFMHNDLRHIKERDQRNRK